jgi:predicted kinase
VCVCACAYVRACVCACVRALTLIEAQALSTGDKLVIDRCNVDAHQRSHWLAIASAHR